MGYSEAADTFARYGFRPSRPTLSRYIRSGVKVGGEVVKLEAVRVGGGWRVTSEAVAEFVAATTAAAIA